MIESDFAHWLDKYKAAWENLDPEASVALYAADAPYRDYPFEKQPVGSAEIRRYMSENLALHQDVSFNYEILAVRDQMGISRWSATYTHKPDRALVELDGVFVVHFNDQGLCSEFEEWWHKRVTPRSGQ